MAKAILDLVVDLVARVYGEEGGALGRGAKGMQG